MPPTLNCDRDSDPDTGRWRSIWPCEFFEQRDRQADRQIKARWGFPPVAESELVDENRFSAVQLLLVEQVAHVDRQGAPGYRIAGVF